MGRILGRLSGRGWKRSQGESEAACRTKNRRARDEGSQQSVESGVHGVRVQRLRDSTYVVELEKSSIFSKHTSWMLQSVVSEERRVDAFLQYVEDEEVLCGCDVAGISRDSVMVGRLRGTAVKAVGATGKRSLVLALVLSSVLSSVLRDRRGHRELSKLLHSYGIYSEFAELTPNFVYKIRACFGPDPRISLSATRGSVRIKTIRNKKD